MRILAYAREVAPVKNKEISGSLVISKILVG